MSTIILFFLFVILIPSLDGATMYIPGLEPGTFDPVTVKEQFGMHYVYFGSQRLNWIQAHKFCVKHEMQLVDTPTKEQFDWIAKELIPSNSTGVDFVTTKLLSWTAINDILDEGNFTDLYTARPHKEFYYAEQYHGDGEVNIGGNNRDGIQHCTTIEVFEDPTTHFLNDFYCDWSLPFICSVPVVKQTECEVCPAKHWTFYW